MKMMWLLLALLWTPLAPPPANAEFGRSAPAPRTAQSPPRFIDAEHLVTLSELATYEVIAPDTLDFTAVYNIRNTSSFRSVLGISLADSIGSTLDSLTYTVVVVDAPSKVSGPATVTANGSWTGYVGTHELLDGSNSLGPSESMTISYKVRIIAEWFSGDWANFSIGPHLGGTVGAGEISGSTDLGFSIPFTTCVNQPVAEISAWVAASTATQSEVRMIMAIYNPNDYGCIGGGNEPVYEWADLEDGANSDCFPSGSSPDFGTALWDSMDVGLGATTWAFGTFDALGGDWDTLATSGDLGDDDALAPTVSNRPEWELFPDILPLAEVNHLGPNEWIQVLGSFIFTHNANTSWTTQLFATSFCPSCDIYCARDSITVELEALPVGILATRMTLGEVTGSTGAYSMPCSVFVKNLGTAPIEKIGVRFPIADAFSVGTDALVDITSYESKTFSENPNFDGTSLHDSITTFNAGDELAANAIDTCIVVIEFDEGDQTSWSFASATEATQDGAGAAIEDTTNCGSEYDDGDMDPNEDGDNAPCVWSIEVAGDRLEWADLTYEGAFTMPSATMSTHSVGACSWYPDGDPGNPLGGPPGSLIVGKSDASADKLFSFAEISIPEPLITNDYDLLPIATVLSGPDAVDGQGNYSDAELYWTGTEWRLWTVRHSNTDNNSPGFKKNFMMTMPLGASTTYGPWSIDYPNRLQHDMNWYVIGIDPTWAAQYANGRTLGMGRSSDGRGHQGFNFYAFSPLKMDVGSLPPANTNLPGSTLLMQWEIREGSNGGDSDEPQDIEEWMDKHAPPDFYNGGAWIAGTKQALVISIKNKCYGQWYYGWRQGLYPDAVNFVPDHDWCYSGIPTCEDRWAAIAHQWVGPHEGFLEMQEECCLEPDLNPPCQECPGNGGSRGPSADRYVQELVFFDTNDIALVATGQMDPIDLEPYLRVDWRDLWFRYNDPTMSSTCNLSIPNYEGYSGPYAGGAMAFDPENRKLYVTEYMGSCTASGGRAGIIHVFGVAGTSP